MDELNERRIKNPYRKKSPRGFRLGYAIFCAALLALIVVGIAIFYDFIRVYESCLPEHIAEEYINGLDGTAFSSLISEKLAESGSGFETPDAVGKTVASALDEGVTFTEAIGEGSGVYDVYCGGRFMKLTLSPSKKMRYGFSRYEIASAEIYDEWFDARVTDVTVVVPSSASLSLNGIEVGGDRLTGMTYDSASLSEFERDGHSLSEYKIENVFGDVDVTAVYGGEPLLISYLGGIYYSDYDLSSRADYTLKAPADAVVTLNGVEVGGSYITGTERVGGVESEFEPDATPELSIYTIPKLCASPSVSVTLGGETLTPDESGNRSSFYSYPDSYRRRYTVRVPVGAELFCNGFAVGEKYLLDGGDGVYELPDGASGVSPTARYRTYEVGLYNDPVFTLDDAHKNAAADHADGSFEYTFYAVPSAAEAASVTDAAENFTRLFVKYSYEGTKYTQQNFDNVMAHVVAGSAADKIITPTLSSMIYNSNFKVDKLEMTVRDIAKFSDDCMALKVDFKSHGTYYKYEKSGDGTYVMVWVKKGGEWMLSGFKM